MEMKRVILNAEIIYKLEKLRFDAYGLGSLADSFDYFNTVYTREMFAQKYLIFATFFHDDILAACYVSNLFHSLYIEQLFVKFIYQERGFALGYKLLKYVLSQVSLIEQHYRENFLFSELSPSSLKAEKIYENLGYKKMNNGVRMRKILR